jgi:SOS-response transcriptional repressor LexA
MIDQAMTGCVSSEPYALQVTDNSMEPEFPARCVIIVDPFPQCEDGAFVVAEYDDVRWFRRFVMREGRRFLVALNPLYPEFELTGPYTIVGLVVQRNVRRKIKHYPMGQLP